MGCASKFLRVAVDALERDVIDAEFADGESADSLRPFLKQLTEEIDVEVLMSDDHDSYNMLADELGLEHSICRAYVNTNVAKPVGDLAAEALAWATTFRYLSMYEMAPSSRWQT